MSIVSKHCFKHSIYVSRTFVDKVLDALLLNEKTNK